MKNYSVLIPVKNNAQKLGRLLSYYAKQRIRFPVFIADSSDDEAVHEVYLRWHGNFESYYVKYRPDTGIHEKVYSALPMIPTPLVAIGADDDFYIPFGLDAAAGWLKTHDDYSVCSGTGITFSMEWRRIATAEYRQRSIEHESARERLQDHLSHYVPVWYSMQRTSEASQNYAKAVAACLSPWHFGESLTSCLSIIQGKSKVLDCLFMVRELYLKRSSRAPAYNDWVHDPGFARERVMFKAIIQGSSGINLSDCDAWVQLYINSLQRYQTFPPPKSLRESVGYYMPWLTDLIQRHTGNPFDRVNLENAASPFYEEWRQIRAYL